jgi:hypothetical protein
MNADMERRHQWKFFPGEQGMWVWRQIPPEGRAVSSPDGFLSLSDCIADARRNGYVLWTSRERRKSSSARLTSSDASF